MSIDRVLEKVRRLRALAGSPNQHEALAAARLAERLIQEHRLSEAEIGGPEGWLNGPAEDPDPMYFGQRTEPWSWRLAIVLAAHYDCAAYASKRRRPVVCSTCGAELGLEPRPCSKKRRGMCKGEIGPIERTMHLVGRKDDVALVREQYRHFHAEIIRLAGRQAFTRSAFGSYKLGCVTGIAQALAEERRRVHASASTGAAMVLASRYEESEATMARLYPRMPKAGGPSIGEVTNDVAYAYGCRDGHALEERTRTKRLTKETE